MRKLLSRLPKMLCLIVLSIGIVGSLAFIFPHTSHALSGQREDANSISMPVAGPQGPATAYVSYLPIVAFSPPLRVTRFGFGMIGGPLSAYPEAASLGAGWYMSWYVTANPSHPTNMEYVQNIRVHQKLTCPLYSADAHDRSRCPYVVPHDYIVMPELNVIADAIRGNPGSLWLIGNEMDRRDWPGGGQDEMLPELYAVAYYDLFHFIKARDPAARVAIGGVIQATPLRLAYLDRVWDAYQQRYGAPMPVDVWNVHNFVLREKLNEYGADIPPGIDATTGAYVGVPDGQTHVDMTIFVQQIRAFRAWMKDHGQQDKPLIVSEYGVLYTHDGLDDPAKVQGFMTATFDAFLGTEDCNLGYISDDCRLVQRWAWYSLNDTGDLSGTNPYGALLDPSSGQLTETGTIYRSYATSH